MPLGLARKRKMRMKTAKKKKKEQEGVFLQAALTQIKTPLPVMFSPGTPRGILYNQFPPLPAWNNKLYASSPFLVH
jgi:hypothetical protein